MRAIRPLLLIWITASGSALPAASPVGYYRQPALHKDTIVFTAEGDLWRVSASGGIAQRLTTHSGVETLPAISPAREGLGHVRPQC